ncbi:MAG: hypothetical protein RJB66_1781 [Pseudomonadota bacterium]
MRKELFGIKSQKGVSLIELSLVVGVSAIILYAVASMSNMGFQSLKHMRIGNDLQAVENLVSLTLARPPTAAENAAKQRVCKNSIVRPQSATIPLDKYTGAEVNDIGIVDSGKKNVLLGLNNSEYLITAKIEAKKDGPIDFKYPDENGVIGDFKYYLTQMTITGTKQGDDNLGGKVVRGRVALAIITKADGTFFDCSVDTNDPKRVCELLGGRYDSTKIPSCLYLRLAVASDWTKLPTIFNTGNIYGENLLFLGDKNGIAQAQTQWSLGHGITIGGLNGLNGLGVALGEHSSGTAAGVAVNYRNRGMYSMIAYPNPTPGWTQMGFATGAINLRTYGERPLVVDTCPDNGAACDGALYVRTKKSAQMTLSTGPFISAHPDHIAKLLSAPGSPAGMDNVGIATFYKDGKWMGLGRASDAFGLFFMTDKPPAGRPNPTLGGVYWGDVVGRGGVPGALVLKAYNKNDLIFQIYQPNPMNTTNCGADYELCTPMLVRGDTGNVGIGGGLFNPEAKLTVNGRGVYSGLFRNTVISGDLQTARDYLSSPGTRVDGTNFPGFVSSINGWSVGIGRAGNGTGGVGLGITQGLIPKGTIFYETNASYDRLRIQAFERPIFMDVTNNPNSPNPLLALQTSRNVGIDTPTPQYKLDVAGPINAQGSLRIGGAQICTAGGCTASSDERLKTQINPLENSLDKILQLHGKSYLWRDPATYGQGPQIGLIAQEVEKIFPEVVTTDETTQLKRVSYPHLLAPLIEAFRALVGKFNVVETQFQSIKAEWETLKLSITNILSEQQILQRKIERLEKDNADLRLYLCTRDPKAPFCKHQPY